MDALSHRLIQHIAFSAVLKYLFCISRHEYVRSPPSVAAAHTTPPPITGAVAKGLMSAGDGRDVSIQRHQRLPLIPGRRQFEHEGLPPGIDHEMEGDPPLRLQAVKAMQCESLPQSGCPSLPRATRFAPGRGAG